MSYSVATFTRIEPNADGTATMVFTHTGNAGEPPVEQKVPVNTSVMPTADWSRQQAMERQQVLNTNRSFVAGAQASIGTVLDTTTPLPTVTPVYGAYRATSAPFTPGATPQDVFTITGSATRLVRVTAFGICTVQTTAGINSWLVNKRSTANTAGTSTAVTRVPNKTSHPAATATVLQYTANPTAGTLVGSIWSGRVVSPAPASVGVCVGRDLDYSRYGIELVGVGEVLAWNFGGAALPAGLSVQAVVGWEEIA